MISTERYSRLLRVPDVKTALFASVIGRLPMGMATLAILLLVQSHSASFAKAGLVSALYVLGLALLAPFLGRLIDRFGPRPVLIFCALAFPAALVTLTILVGRDAQLWALALAAMAAGASFPPVTVCMRALYSRSLSDAPLLQAAYSLDSALIEVIFILGPVLVAAFVAIGRPGGAVIFAACCACLGCGVFARTPAMVKWKRRSHAMKSSLAGPLAVAELRAVLSATVLYAASFGMFEVAVTALAAKQGAPGAAGVMLALASVGSALGALTYGSRDWDLAPENLFVAALIAMAAGMLLLAPIENLYLFGAVAVIACAPMAPVIAVQSVLISRVAPRAMFAESFTWGATMLLVGVSIGVALGGALVERIGPALLCTAAAGSTVLAAIVGFSVRRKVAPAPRQAPRQL